MDKKGFGFLGKFLFLMLPLFVLFLCVINIKIPPVAAGAPNAPANLRACDKVNPAGTGGDPYFGWYVNDPDDNEIQTKYQVLVASSQSNLDSNLGDQWDSGQVSSGRQNHIDYAGSPLTSNTRYYWKVRTWDKDGNVSPYSATGIFDVGLLSNSDWSGAKWIKRNNTESDDYTYYRKKITLPAKTVKRAMAYISACHKYELYINGVLIGKGPAYHYPQYQYYNAFNITANLTANSDNQFAILHHWFGGGQGRPAGTRGLIMKVIVEYTDGASLISGTDGTWKAQRANWVTGMASRNGEGVGYIEKIDATVYLNGWETLGFNDSGWEAVTEIGTHPVSPWTGNLSPDLTRVIETEITPVSVTDKGSGKYVIDLGKVYAGIPKITFSGGTAGTTVNMRGGYTLNADGTVSTATTQSTNMSYYLIISGGSCIFKPLEYLGMRYFQVDNSPNVLSTSNVKFIKRYYELDGARSSFTSSSVTLNNVWNLMKDSLYLGAQEQFVDTPTREKGGFLVDTGPIVMPVFGERALNRRVLKEYLQSQDQYWSDGRVNCVYPNSDGERDIPDYTQFFLVWVWDYYLQSGDQKFLNDNYTRLQKIITYLNSCKNGTTGLIHNLTGGSGDYQYGIIDWPKTMRYGYDMTTQSRTVIDAYAYLDYLLMAKIAGELGKSADRDSYQLMADNMKSAMNTRLINTGGVYVDGIDASYVQSGHVSQQANIFPAALRIVPVDKLGTVVGKIKELRMQIGMQCLRWLPQALGESDEGAHLIQLYTDSSWEGWAKLLTKGATAVWECWDADITSQSMSHPWGSAGLYGIQQYMLGMKVLLPQHEKIQIKPLTFDTSLTGAAGTLPTDRGEVTVNWDRNESRFYMTLTIPDNMKAKVYVPKSGTTGAIVKVDGGNVTGVEEGNYVYVDNIGSGTHTFERAAAPWPTPTPTSTPIPGGVTLFLDDFSGDLSKWENTSNATISNGQLTLTNNEYMRSVAGGTNWTDYNYEADVKITSNAAGLAFRCVDSNNYYMWQLNASTGMLRPHKKVGGTWTVIKEVSAGITLNTTYHVKIEANGSSIKTYLGGNLVDTTIDSVFSGGKIGFRQGNTGETAVFDNILAQTLGGATPGPTPTPTPGSQINVALASNGGTASASTSYSSGNYPPAAVINGDRKGLNWGSGGGWNDNTSFSFPDWIQVDFSGNKTISEIDLFTLQDNYASPVEPTETMTMSLYGVTSFDVQHWNGSSWVTVTGGTVTGNSNVWRKFTFSSVVTGKVRISVNGAKDGKYSRVTEMEVWGN